MSSVIGSIREFADIGELFRQLTPEYRYYEYRPMIVSYGWRDILEHEVSSISPSRVAKRVKTYIMPGELDRVRTLLADNPESVSIRFGHEKLGHGIAAKRGDFCLVAGAFRKNRLALFYRSLELFGGLAYDQGLIFYIKETLNLDVKFIDLYAVRARTAAMRGNSNEKLHVKLKEIYRVSTKPRRINA